MGMMYEIVIILSNSRPIQKIAHTEERAVKAISLFLCLVLSFSASAYAKSASEVCEQVSSSVVVVGVQDDKRQAIGFGGGIVISSGEVVTNAHVIKGAAEIFVHQGGQSSTGKIHYADWDRDLCQLTVQSLKTPAALIGSTKGLKTGGRVYAIVAPGS
jgi:S1-C subfamily serine protease